MIEASSKAITDRIVQILEDKKAKEISIINIKDVTILTDYFIVCSGTSTTHVRALADEVGSKLREEGMEHLHHEGYDTARWILLDYAEVVVHIFHPEERKFYNLERLWHHGITTHLGDIAESREAE